MQRRHPAYDPSPRTADLPLTLAEAEAIVAGEGSDIRPAKAARHFSMRVLVTLRHHLETVRQLHARLEAATARANSTAGRASTLNPLDAVRYLTAEQRADLCQGLLRDQYKAAATDRDRAGAELAAARRATAELRLVLLRLAGDASVPEPTAGHLKRALTALADLHNADLHTADPTSAPAPEAAASAADAETLGELFGDEEGPS